MSESRVKRPPALPQKLSLPFMTGSAFVFLVMIALPVSQMVSGSPKTPAVIVDPTTLNRPDDIPIEKPVLDKPDKPVIDDLKKDVEPPPLNVIENMIRTDLSGIHGGDYEISYGGFGDTLIEDTLYGLDELTRPPRAIRQQQPIYPSDLKMAGIEGEVVLTFIVRADGTTSKVEVEHSTNPGFEQPAVRSARKWTFQPGEKDGKVVSTIVRIQIPFRIDKGL